MSRWVPGQSWVAPFIYQGYIDGQAEGGMRRFESRPKLTSVAVDILLLGARERGVGAIGVVGDAVADDGVGHGDDHRANRVTGRPLR